MHIQPEQAVPDGRSTRKDYKEKTQRRPTPQPSDCIAAPCRQNPVLCVVLLPPQPEVNTGLGGLGASTLL